MEAYYSDFTSLTSDEKRSAHRVPNKLYLSICKKLVKGKWVQQGVCFALYTADSAFKIPQKCPQSAEILAAQEPRIDENLSQILKLTLERNLEPHMPARGLKSKISKLRHFLLFFSSYAFIMQGIRVFANLSPPHVILFLLHLWVESKRLPKPKNELIP